MPDSMTTTTKVIWLAVTILALCKGVLPQGNQYLPPSPGYHYDTPKVPFPTNPRPQTQPTPRPPTLRPTYGPPGGDFGPVTRPPPTPPRPTFTPPRPTYSPPPPQPPTYTPGIPTRPTLNIPPNPPPTYPRPTAPPNNPPPGAPGHVHVPGNPYDFNYAVKDDYYGTDYAHNAISDGDQVKGEYRVRLPDGRMQIVSYVADWATGFHADVRYEGQASYPQGGQQQGAASYQRPQQVLGGPY